MVKENEIIISRLINAPRKLVFEAFTKPEHLIKWWGPRGFTITTHSKDLRVGGHWDYMMHGPDGTDYPNKTKYFVPSSKVPVFASYETLTTRYLFWL